MYSNNFSDIRSGLVNYLGSSLCSLELNTSENAKHIVIAMLIEEAINLAKDSNGSIDIKDAKPILRGASLILNQRAFSIQEDIKDKSISDRLIKPYMDCKENIDSILNKIK